MNDEFGGLNAVPVSTELVMEQYMDAQLMDDFGEEHLPAPAPPVADLKEKMMIQ
jgi:hypothetical protein